MVERSLSMREAPGSIPGLSIFSNFWSRCSRLCAIFFLLSLAARLAQSLLMRQPAGPIVLLLPPPPIEIRGVETTISRKAPDRYDIDART